MSNNVYLGNPNLKKANTEIEFTEEQISEFIKCREDPVYFAKTISRSLTLMRVLSVLICGRFKRS